MSDERVSIEGNVDELEISVRAHNALAGNSPWVGDKEKWKERNLKKIVTIKDLVSLTPKQLLQYPNFGKACLKEVENELARHGLSLGMDLTAKSTPQDILKDLTLEEIKSLMPHLDFGAPVITQMSKDPEDAASMFRDIEVLKDELSHDRDVNNLCNKAMYDYIDRIQSYMENNTEVLRVQLQDQDNKLQILSNKIEHLEIGVALLHADIDKYLKKSTNASSVLGYLNKKFELLSGKVKAIEEKK